MLSKWAGLDEDIGIASSVLISAAEAVDACWSVGIGPNELITIAVDWDRIEAQRKPLANLARNANGT